MNIFLIDKYANSFIFLNREFKNQIDPILSFTKIKKSLKLIFK